MTGIPDIELSVERLLTKAFIDTMPVELVLTPRTRVKTATGGVEFIEGTPREPQIMRFIEYNSEIGQAPEASFGNSARQRYSQYELLAEWNANLEVYDIFEFGDDKWNVIEFLYDNGWEKRARVERFGGES